ncbi:hypothetical protein B0J13DRAFT_657497 [Dactylonectria estremocensis]|uniref:Uncharacterized protein n=1 Tax=Dactylonectria estremocensis TaxID=1079267 RepID=A0A9P9D5Y0_9HYPO|nr:hypothetical protein B0J13DRAFT_657497 [Dactylonectria estremocensis]
MYIRARILVYLLFEYNGFCGHRQLADALRALREGFGGRKWDSATSLAALTLFYIHCEHPAHVQVSNVLPFLSSITLPSEGDLLSQFGTNFAQFQLNYLYYLGELRSIPQAIESPQKTFQMSPLRFHDLSLKRQVLTCSHAQVQAAAIFAAAISNTSEKEAIIRYLEATRELQWSDRMPDLGGYADTWAQLSSGVVTFIRTIKPLEVRFELHLNSLESRYMGDVNDLPALDFSVGTTHPPPTVGEPSLYDCPESRSKTIYQERGVQPPYPEFDHESVLSNLVGSAQTQPTIPESSLSYSISKFDPQLQAMNTQFHYPESQGPLAIDDSNVDFQSYGQQDPNHFLQMDDPSVWSPTTGSDIDVADHLV